MVKKDLSRIKNPSWGCLIGRMGKLIRETSVSTRGGLFAFINKRPIKQMFPISEKRMQTYRRSDRIGKIFTRWAYVGIVFCAAFAYVEFFGDEKFTLPLLTLGVIGGFIFLVWLIGIESESLHARIDLLEEEELSVLKESITDLNIFKRETQK
jgi:hypothetical protein